MSIKCNVCQSTLIQAVYQSKANKALTSLCAVVEGQTEVLSCHNCGHIMTRQLLNAEQYYADDYKILLSHDDEDQIYEMRGGQIVYRTQHQLSTLLAKIKLKPGARVLDYGCAKAAMPKQLLAIQPDLRMHLFDVSDMYQAHWEKFLPADHWAIHHIPVSWKNSFDLVTSYFALEHIDDPVASMKAISDLLSSDGIFYGIVPDTVGNVADFIVIDHVNHFTAASLHFALRQAGFVDIQIDTRAHRGAFVFVARKFGDASRQPEISDAHRDACRLGSFWDELSDRLIESVNPNAPAAIYGSGFYGAFILTTLSQMVPIRCFLDASPYQQGKTIQGLPVLAPHNIPEDVRVLYIGLNPSIASKAVAEMEWIAGRDLRIVYLQVGSYA